MFRSLTIVLFLALFAGTAEALMTWETLMSPNGDFQVVIYSGPFNQTSFGIFYKGKLIASVGKLAFEVNEDDFLPATASFRNRESKFGNRAWQPGDEPALRPSKYATSSTRAQTRSASGVEGQADFNEYTVIYALKKEVIPAGIRYETEDYDGFLKIVFRVYDDGIAYRYEMVGVGAVTIKNECAEFSFPDDYAVEGSAGSLSKISNVQPSPLLIKIPDVPMLSFGEVSQDGFPALRFKPGRIWAEGATFNNLYDSHGKVDRSGRVTAVAMNLDGEKLILGSGYQTPWRFIKFASPCSKEMINSLSGSSGEPRIIFGIEFMR